MWDNDAKLAYQHPLIEGKPDLHDSRWLNVELSLRRTVLLNARGAIGLNPDMVDRDDFWTLGYHKNARVTCAPPEWVALGLGMVKRQLLLNVGGWDEDFETTGQATVDLGLRLQRHGVKFAVWRHIVQALGYEPGTDDSRSGINAAYESDLQKYLYKWSLPDVLRTKVDVRPDADHPGAVWARRLR